MEMLKFLLIIYQNCAVRAKRTENHMLTILASKTSLKQAFLEVQLFWKDHYFCFCMYFGILVNFSTPLTVLCLKCSRTDGYYS